MENESLIAPAARAAGLPLHAAYALLQMESGGANVFGSDRGGMFRGEPVTRARYEAMVEAVARGHASNGVGPTQITWRGFFPDAAKRGFKLWEPASNMEYGFRLLASYAHLGWEKAGTKYNGKASYGKTFARSVGEWKTKLGKEVPVSKSQNGWPASPTLRTRTLKVAGVAFRIADDDDVESVFGYVAAQFNARVESLPGKVADDWGFAYRANRNNPNSLSNHASGTAIDFNATQHPNAVATARTFTAAEIAEVRKIVAECAGVVRWGGDYHNTPDAMHFEIDVPPGSPKLAAVAKRLRGDRAEPKPAPKPAPAPKPKRALILRKAVTPGGTDPQVRVLQQLLIDAGYGPIKGAPSNYYGENTQAAVARFHRAHPDLTSGDPDPVIGPLGFKELQREAAAKK